MNNYLKKASSEEPNIAQVDVGELLMSKRHSLGMSIDEVAQSIKLAPDIIDKLESNQFSAIGSAVYVKGYISLYAKHLSLDAAHVLNLYQTQHPSEVLAIRPSLDHSVGKKQSKRYSKTVSFVLAVMTFIGLIYAYEQLEPMFLSSDTTVTESAEVSTNDTAASSEANVAGNNTTENLNSVVQAADNAQTLADDVLNDVTITNNLAAANVQNDVQLSLDADSTAQNGDSAEINLTSTEAESTEDTVAEEPAAEEPKTIHLVMTFKEDCWLKITDAEGKILASNTYSEKRKIDVKGIAPLEAVIGRPNTIKLVNIDGKKVKLSDYKTGNVKYAIK